MNKIDIDIGKDEILYMFKLLYENGKLSASEYKKAADKVAALKLKRYS